MPTHASNSKTKKLRILTPNCHEAWVHQLGVLNHHDLEIIDGLPNRYTKQWDQGIRPVPDNARLISLEEALHSTDPYDCIIVHNMTDLMDVKTIPGPRILVLHATLEGRIASEKANFSTTSIQKTLKTYMNQMGGHCIAVSRMKGKSWGFREDIVPCGVDPNSYLEWRGEDACGLRVANQIQAKRLILDWDFHEQAFGQLPVRVVGHNPEMHNVHPSQSWSDLKSLLSRHRFFIHTANPEMEDGYNMASLEAMAAGLPILGNVHPTSPITHGVDGFLSNDPDELKKWAEELLKDKDLAYKMGQAARKTVVQKFTLNHFATRMKKSISTAQKKFNRQKKRR